MKWRTSALLAAVGMTLAVTPTATAQEGFSLDRSVYGPLEVVHVSAAATSGCQGPVTSNGFEGPIELHTMPGPAPTLYGSGTAVGSVGTYTAQATCRGEVVTRTFTVRRVDPPVFTFSLDKEEYDPGAEIRIQAVLVTGRCPSTVTSPGFAAPIVLAGNPGPGAQLAGSGKAVTTPGSYTAEVFCPGVPPFTQTFRVKGTGAQPPGPAPQPQPRPKVVQPKGAPDTGGGSTTP